MRIRTKASEWNCFKTANKNLIQSLHYKIQKTRNEDLSSRIVNYLRPFHFSSTAFFRSVEHKYNTKQIEIRIYASWDTCLIVISFKHIYNFQYHGIRVFVSGQRDWDGESLQCNSVESTFYIASIHIYDNTETTCKLPLSINNETNWASPICEDILSVN